MATFSSKVKVRVEVYLGDFETDGRNFVIQTDTAKPSAELREQIIKKANRDDVTDYVLFFPREKKYLNPDEPLRSYDISDDDLLQFRNRFRTLKILVETGAVKTVKVDDTKPVQATIAKIGEKLKIRHFQEFCLKLPDPLEWLRGELTLPEQGLLPTDDTTLTFGKVFYIYDQAVSKEDASELNLLFTSSLDKIAHGDLPCTLPDSLLIAPLAWQALFRDWSEQQVDHRLEQVFPPELIPKKKSEAVEMQETVVQEWKKLKGMSPDDAKYKCLQVMRGLPTYGVNVFVVERKPEGKKKNKKGENQFKLCVSKNRLIFLDPNTNQSIKTFELKHLRRWGAAGDGIMFDFSTYDPDSQFQRFITEQKAQISDLLEGYIKLLLKKKKGFGGTLERGGSLTLRPVDIAVKEAMRALVQGDSSRLMARVQDERALNDPYARIKKLADDLNQGTSTQAEQLVLLHDLLRAACQQVAALVD